MIGDRPPFIQLTADFWFVRSQQLADFLRTPRRDVVFMFCKLWWWAVEHAEDGIVRGPDALERIALACGWLPRRPLELFARAVTLHGVIDVRTDGCVLRGMRDRYLELMQRRRKTADKVRKHRAKKTPGVSRGVIRGVTSRVLVNPAEGVAFSEPVTGYEGGYRPQTFNVEEVVVNRDASSAGARSAATQRSSQPPPTPTTYEAGGGGGEGLSGVAQECPGERLAAPLSATEAQGRGQGTEALATRYAAAVEAIRARRSYAATWLERLVPLREEQGALVLGAEQAFFLEWVKEHYRDDLEEELGQVAFEVSALAAARAAAAPTAVTVTADVKTRADVETAFDAYLAKREPAAAVNWDVVGWPRLWSAFARKHGARAIYLALVDWWEDPGIKVRAIRAFAKERNGEWPVAGDRISIAAKLDRGAR